MAGNQLAQLPYGFQVEDQQGVDKRLVDTIFAEVGGGSPDEVAAVTSTFLNKSDRDGLDKALNISSAYRKKSPQYVKAENQDFNPYEEKIYNRNKTIIENLVKDPNQRQPWTHFENVKAFGEPSWAKGQSNFKDIGRQRFYKIDKSKKSSKGILSALNPFDVTDANADELPQDEAAQLPQGFQVEDGSAQVLASSPSPAQAARGAMAVRGLPVLGSLAPINKEDFADQSQLPAEFQLEDQISQGKAPSLMDKIQGIFSKSPEQRQAEAANIYAISKSTGLDPLFVEKNYDKIKTDPKVTGLSHQIDNAGQLALGAGAPFLAAGAIEAPIATAAGAAAFSLLDKFVDLNKFVPEDTADPIKKTVEAVDFIGKALATHGIFKTSPKLVEAFTKQKIEDFKLPTQINLSGEQVRDIYQTGKLTTPEQVQLYSALNLSREQVKNALSKGIDITVPTEKIVTLTDKPWFAKVKGIFGMAPESTTIKSQAGAPQEVFPGLPAPKDIPPEVSTEGRGGQKPPAIIEAEKHGTVVGMDAATKLPIIDTSKPALIPALPASQTALPKPDNAPATPFVEKRTAAVPVEGAPKNRLSDWTNVIDAYADKDKFTQISQLPIDNTIKGRLIEHYKLNEPLLNTEVPKIGGGTPPKKGLVVANIGSDGKIYYGDPGQLHYNLLEKYGDNLRSNLKEGEPTFIKTGFSGPDGKFLNREEALKVSGIKSQVSYLDAKEYQLKGNKNVQIPQTEKEITKSAESETPIEAVGANAGGVSTTSSIPNPKVDYYKNISSRLSSESGQAKLPGVDEAAAITKDIINYVSPRTFVPRPSLDTVMTELGHRNKLEFELETSMGKVTKFFDKQKPADNVAFIDRIKTGQKQPTKELQATADMMRDIEDIMHTEAKQFKPSLAYKDNHYRVLWKTIPGSKAAAATTKGGFKGNFRRPFQGSKGFAKQSTLADMSEGIQRGGVPQSYNPSVMWQNGLVDMQKFITANRMFKTLKDIGYVKFIKLGGSIPDGFKKLDDRISTVYFPTDPGLVHAGNYYVEENTARILNNFLSRDLIRESNLGKGLLALKNVTTSLELSLSPFHAAYTALTASASEIGTGLQKMYNIGLLQGNGPEFLKGLRDVALSVRAPYYLTRVGTNIIQMVREKDFLKTPAGQSFIKEFPHAREMLDDLFTGGGKLAMHQDYKINSLRAFKEGLKNKEPWAVTLSALPAANEMLMKPLFEQFIPRLKIGNFLREYSQELVARADQLASGKLTRPQLARQVWDSVENRFGEMNFDNLFWNRTFKSAMQLLFRSVTWKIGALKNITSGTAGQVGEIVDAIQGRHAPKLNRNTAYLLGLASLIYAASEIIQQSNGQGHPKTLKDVMAPRYDSEGNRISLNTHLKDWVHIAHSPAGFVQNSLSGDIGKEFDIWNNKDFYGVKIYNEDDPIWKKEMDKFKHRFPTPFAITSIDRLNQIDAPMPLEVATALGFLQPSPKYITNTKSEQLASEIVKNKIPVGARTKEQYEASKERFKMMEDYRKNGKLDAINEALQSHKIDKKQMNDIIKKAGQTPLERMTNHMSFDEVSRLIEVAEKKELTVLIPIFTAKIDRKIKSAKDADEKSSFQKIKSDLLNKYE